MSGFDFLIDLLSPAMEEDITGQVEEAVDNTFGRGGSSIKKNPTGFDGERDMSQTDDIFGTGSKDAGGGEEKSPTDETEDESPNENPDGENEEEGNEDDPGDGTEGEEDPGVDSGSNEPKIFKKNYLRDNMVAFYNVLVNNIDLLSESIGNLNEQQSIDITNKVIDNIREIKRLLMNAISNDLSNNEYEEVLRKYITLRRVYDISIEMLDKHFGNIHFTRNPKRKNSRKKKQS